MGSTSFSTEEKLHAMRMGTDYRMPISIRSLKIHVRPLTVAEILDTATKVSDDLNRLPGSSRNALMEHHLLAKYTLVLASTSGPGLLDYRLTDGDVEGMTADELVFLFKQYVGACDKVNPALETIPDSEIEELVEHLKKNPSTLTELSFSAVINVCRHLLKSSPADK